MADNGAILAAVTGVQEALRRQGADLSREIGGVARDVSDLKGSVSALQATSDERPRPCPDVVGVGRRVDDHLEAHDVARRSIWSGAMGLVLAIVGAAAGGAAGGWILFRFHAGG